MREFSRIIRITRTLDLLWSQPQCADMRLGQLLYNVASYSGIVDADLWNTEDDVWEEAINAYLGYLVLPR